MDYDDLTVVTLSPVNTTQLGVYLAEYLRWLQDDAGVQWFDITLVGHSVGSEVAGIAGHNLNGFVGEIIALDPVSSNDPEEHHKLSRDDAFYVQAILTSRGIIGDFSVDAHQIFYPNNGIIPQPSCPLLEPFFCSHLRAIDFFCASIEPQHEFIARRCTLPGVCVNIYDKLGPHSARNSGAYYLKTIGVHPFALGSEGGPDSA